jgi:hypothetical protein
MQQNKINTTHQRFAWFGVGGGSSTAGPAWTSCSCRRCRLHVPLPTATAVCSSRPWQRQHPLSRGMSRLWRRPPPSQVEVVAVTPQHVVADSWVGGRRICHLVDDHLATRISDRLRRRMRLIYVAFFGIVARERGHAIYVAFLAGKLIERVPVAFLDGSNHRARGGFSHAGGPIARAQVFAFLTTIFLWMF